MRTLVFSDLELHTWKAFGIGKESGLTRRLEEQQDVLDQIIAIVVKEQIKHIIFGGDFFHKVGEIPTECLNVANVFFKQLRKLGVQWFLTTGNHDLVNRISPKWFQTSIGVFNEYKLPTEKVCLVDYNHKVDYDKVKDYDLVVLHKQPTLTNSYGYHFEGVNWKRLAKNNKLVFFGHYHERLCLADNCFTIGSPMHFTFGDKGDRGVWIIDTTTSKVKFEKLKYPEFRTVDTLDEVTDDYNYYRIMNMDVHTDKDNVVSIIKPEVFTERIKSTNFDEILFEWLKLQDKPKEYYDIVKDLVSSKFQTAKKFFTGTILDVSIENFMSIERVSYKVTAGLTLVVGEGGSFNDSNGAGKTSLFEALYWGLFGETTKGLSGDDVIRDRPTPQKDGKVVIRLSAEDGSIIRVVRTRKKGLSVLVSTSGREAIDIVEGKLQKERQTVFEESILGFDSGVFRAACYFSQESLLMLSRLGDADKTNMITDLLGFEKYDDLYNTIGAAIKTTEEAVATIEEERVKEQQSFDAFAIRIEGCENLQKDIKEAGSSFSSKVKEKEEELEKAEIKLKEAEAVSKDSWDFDTELKELNKQCESLSRKDKILLDELDTIAKGNTDVAARKSSVLTELRGIGQSQTTLQDEIDNLLNLRMGERCDKCGAEIAKDNVSLFTAGKNDKIANLEKTRQVLLLKSSDMEEEQTALNIERVDVVSRRDAIATKLSEAAASAADFLTKKRNTEGEVDRLRIEQAGIKSNITKVKELIGVYKDEIIDSKKRADSVGRERKQFETEQLQSKEKLEAMVVRISAKKEHQTVLDFWKVAFSSKGIRSVLLDRFCNEFNTLVNNYVAVLSNGVMGVVVRPMKTLKSGAERNKIGLDILERGKRTSYEKLSGGEKRRIDVSLCLALNKWAGRKYGAKAGLLGMLIFDEVFSFIDSVGVENTANLLSCTAKDRAIFVITHTGGLEGYADSVWSVVKRNHISSLERGKDA